jgi:type IV pilus assembly protein PilB
MMPRLGDILIELGFITPDQLAAGLARQQNDHRRLGELLVAMGIVEEEKIAKALRRQTGVEEWDPYRWPVHRRVIEMFPPDLAIRHRVFPVAMRRNGVGVHWFVATTDPTDEPTKNELARSLCTEDEPVAVTWFVSTASHIERAIADHYAGTAAQAPEEPILLVEEVVEAETKPPTTLGRIRITKKSSEANDT